MNARDKILASIAAGKPALAPLPYIGFAAESDVDLLGAEFIRVLASIGAIATNTTGLELIKEDLRQARLDGGCIVNTIPAIGTVDEEVNAESTAQFLERVEKVYVRGTIGVAENGAIWLSESDMINRLLPFICQHLVIVVDRQKVVANMHEAYGALSTRRQEGYGVFIAGPSRTADIEQSLVTGAHGARSVLVYLVSPETHF
ncbi:MAG TPA: LUD domain-containing protein [Puia sp.]|jgi:L-lactate dehydrogenase complex protein LldG|nr:LUD domain-containing protein [Puia sp.]